MATKDPQKIKEHSKHYRESHREIMRERNRQWREAHPHWWRKYQGTPQRRAQQRAYHIDNRERRREAQRIRYHLNPDKYRLYAMTHYARKQGNVVGEIDLEAIVVRDKERCGICGLRVRKRDRSFDHIVPLSKSGLHCQENLRLVHLLCNKARGNRGHGQPYLLCPTKV